MKSTYDLIVLGGGAAGFFAALRAKNQYPHVKVLLLEKYAALLSKVRVSGGGRCNVTHACFDPVQLSKNYPRGGKELIGPFTRFQPRDTIEWFLDRGVELKTEEDGRMFPTTDSSETIITCLIKEAKELGVEIRIKQRLEEITKENEGFSLKLSNEELFCKKLVLATGSSSDGYKIAKTFGHTIQEPVPSLFTFNVPSFSLIDLAGVALDPVTIVLEGCNLSSRGPLLITHWGFSGPAALKLSAWGARYLHEKKYDVQIKVDWIPGLTLEEIVLALKEERQKKPQPLWGNQNPLQLPKNLWKKFNTLVGIDELKKSKDISNAELYRLSDKLKGDKYHVLGKTTHKEEFVTCGGITLTEINFKNMESKFTPGLFFAGEILDIDAVTGGFNFQNAWTTGYLAGS